MRRGYSEAWQQPVRRLRLSLRHGKDRQDRSGEQEGFDSRTSASASLASLLGIQQARSAEESLEQDCRVALGRAFEEILGQNCWVGREQEGMIEGERLEKLGLYWEDRLLEASWQKLEEMHKPEEELAEIPIVGAAVDKL